MKLFKIALNNYRNFSNYEVTLGHRTTVFIGRNGMGKTNLMEGMVQALSFVFSIPKDTQQYDFIKSTDQSVRSFKSTDPRYLNRNYSYPVSLELEGGINFDNTFIPLDWSFVQMTKKSGLKTSLYKEAYQIFWEHYNTFGEKPVLAFFSDSFPHKDTNISQSMKDKLKSGNPLPACDGYYQWDKEQSCVNIWKKYFIQQWMNNRLNPDDEKEKFVRAINNKLREFTLPIEEKRNYSDPIITELSVEFRDDQPTLLISFEDGNTKPFETLSAGFERAYSMILDLSSRAYLLNGNTNPEGIVFIDEIDLHLHPSFAAEFLCRLRRSFPRLQFIVSTHSPLVISNFDQSEGNTEDYRLINLLSKDGEYYNRIVKNMYGLDYNSSLTNIMGTPLNDRYKDELINAYLYWRENDEERAALILKQLRDRYGNSNAIIRDLEL